MQRIENKRLAKQWSLLTNIPVENIVFNICITDIIYPQNMVNWRITPYCREDYLDWMPYRVQPKAGSLRIHYVNVNQESYIYTHSLMLIVDMADIATIDERNCDGQLISTKSYDL